MFSVINKSLKAAGTDRTLTLTYMYIYILYIYIYIYIYIFFLPFHRSLKQTPAQSQQ